jgi:hypothetical protein
MGTMPKERCLHPIEHGHYCQKPAGHGAGCNLRTLAGNHPKDCQGTSHQHACNCHGDWPTEEHASTRRGARVRYEQPRRKRLTPAARNRRREPETPAELDTRTIMQLVIDALNGDNGRA